MILERCYYVSYHVADFTTKGEPTYHEDAYQDCNNAMLVAKELVKCLDVVDDVYVIDGLTGEILNTISKAMPKEDKVEKNNIPAPTDDTKEEKIPTFINTFEDGFGGVWRKNEEDGLWNYDCRGMGCNGCPYNATLGSCRTNNLSLDNVGKIIAETKKRIGK